MGGENWKILNPLKTIYKGNKKPMIVDLTSGAKVQNFTYDIRQLH